MSEPLDFSHDQVRAGDLNIHVVSLVGNGPRIVLLHGIGMDWRVWQAISRRLRRSFSPMMIDLRGHGESDKPSHGYTLGHYASNVEEILDRLGIYGVILAGSSLGGMVSAVVEAPRDVVTHRVLIDPPLTGGPIRDEATFRDILRLKHQPIERLIEYLRVDNPGAGNHLLRAMSEMWRATSDGVIEDMLARPRDYYDIDSSLRSIDSPTLLMRADASKGGILSAEQADRALRLLSAGTVVEIEGSGHAIHATKPAEFVSLTEQFAMTQ